jgi:hypothetical protein
MNASTSRALRAFRAMGSLILNSGAAIVGTGIVATLGHSALRSLWPAHTSTQIVLREWIISIGFAASIGFLVQKRWRSIMARWVWVVPCLWFLLKVAVYAGAQPKSVIIENNSLFLHFSGLLCSQGIHDYECYDFLFFTLPLIRSISYSIAAGISALMSKNRETPIANLA